MTHPCMPLGMQRSSMICWLQDCQSHCAWHAGWQQPLPAWTQASRAAPVAKRAAPAHKPGPKRLCSTPAPGTSENWALAITGPAAQVSRELFDHLLRLLLASCVNPVGVGTLTNWLCMLRKHDVGTEACVTCGCLCRGCPRSLACLCGPTSASLCLESRLCWGPMPAPARLTGCHARLTSSQAVAGW